MIECKEFATKEDFGQLLREYQEKLVEKMGSRASQAADQLLQQLKSPFCKVFGIIHSDETPMGFIYTRTEGKKNTEGNIDILFLSQNHESDSIVSQLLKTSIDDFIKREVKVIRYLAPSLNSIDIDSILLKELSFESSSRYRVEIDPAYFKNIDTKISDDYEVIPWDDKYALEVSELIVDSYKDTIEPIIFPRYGDIESVLNYINRFLSSSRQGILRDASPICLYNQRVIGTQIMIPISHNHALVWQTHVVPEHRDKVVAPHLFETSINALILLGYSKASFASTSKKVAEHVLRLYPEPKTKLIGESKIYFYKVKDI